MGLAVVGCASVLSLQHFSNPLRPRVCLVDADLGGQSLLPVDIPNDLEVARTCLDTQRKSRSAEYKQFLLGEG